MSTKAKRISTALIGAVLSFAAVSAAQQSVPVLYPKDYALVGNKVNVVLDPTAVSFFQVVVGTFSSPVVDTSTGAHALQGVELEPGINTITVNVLGRQDGGRNAKYKILASRPIRVFNTEGVFSPVPDGFHREPFHTREHEAPCSGCHTLAVKAQDFSREKPEDVPCYTCHRKIPEGAYIHGPAAVWNCLACHNPGLSPAKYSFSPVGRSSPEGQGRARESDPRTQSSAPTVKDVCLTCHASVMNGHFKHGPAAAGYCTLCHDPHASPNPAWLRKPAWDLCTTCHNDKGSGVHVVAGFTNGTHPTRNVPDPIRPGKRLSCASCHDPHSAESWQLIIFNVRSRSELCNVCHKK